MKLRNMIFDMDGVIFDSERTYEEAMYSNAQKYGITPTHDMFLKTVGTSEAVSREIFIAEYGPFDFDAFRADIRAHILNEMKNGRIPLKKGVHNILDFLKDNGVRIALATSTRRYTAEDMLNRAGLLACFQETVCGDEVKRAKPDPEIFLTACARLGGTPEDTLIIEDSYNGIRAANAAGIPVLMVPDMLPPLEELATFGIAQDLDEAQRMITPLVLG